MGTGTGEWGIWLRIAGPTALFLLARIAMELTNLAVVGRYILPGRIMEILENTQRGAGGEIQLTDAIAALLDQQQVLAYEFEGTRYDCGSKLGYLEATIDYALQHPELQDQFRAFLRQKLPTLA